MIPKLSDGVLAALEQTKRAPGWNNRSRDVSQFQLTGNYGRDCTLYVVPFRRWAYRRQEQQAAAWRAEHGRAQA